MKTPTQRLLGRMAHRGISRERAFAAIRAAHFLARPDRFVTGRLLRRRHRNGHGTDFALPPDTAYRLFQAPELDGTAAMVAAARQIVERSRGDVRDGMMKQGFLENVLTDETLVRTPALVDFVLQPKIIDVAADYLGTLPRLCSVAVNYTPVNDTTLVSQRWHRDSVDTRQCKFIVNITDVDDGNGPFTFVPADASERLIRQAADDWGRLDDDQVDRFAPSAQVVVRGPSGSGVCVDTSRCFHFGARARDGERMVLIFNFTGPYRVGGEGKLPALYQAFRHDPLRRAILLYHAP